MGIHRLLQWLGTSLVPAGLSLLCFAAVPAQAQFYDVAVTSIINVPPLVCDTGLVSPRITIKSNSTEVITSVILLYGVPGVLPSINTWQGSLQPGQTVNHFLPPIILPGGEHVLTVNSSSPNGQVDQVPENDAWSIPVVVSEPAEVVTLRLQLDNFGSDITWSFVTDQGTELYAGGPYTNVNGGELIELPLCLSNGCYTFTINDLFGDGLCCSGGIGSYSLTGSEGTVYATSDGQFGAQDVQTFCLVNVSIEEHDRTVSMELFPNPTKGNVRVLMQGMESPIDLRLMDGTGRIVQQHRVSEAGNGYELELGELANGVYLLHAEQQRGTVVRRVVLER